MWAAPMIRSIGTPAFANSGTPSPCENLYGVKWDEDGSDDDNGDDDNGGTGTVCEDLAEGAAVNCILNGGTEDVSEECRNRGVDGQVTRSDLSPGGCSRVVSVDINPDGSWTVVLADGCTFCAGSRKAGTDCFDFGTVTGDKIETDDQNRCVITFGKPNKAISHVELIFCCSPGV